MERFQFLAGVIAAHHDHQIVGRTRLQKTVRLLQRLGAPLDYDYMLYFYGPYSEGLQAEIGILENLKLVEEQPIQKPGQPSYYILHALEPALKFAERAEIKEFQAQISIMNEADATILELAATYDAFKELGSDNDEAMRRLRQKKGAKCDDGRDGEAVRLFRELGLES